jgi:predicted acylesterase/phospholipase RssA
VDSGTREALILGSARLARRNVVLQKIDSMTPYQRKILIDCIAEKIFVDGAKDFMVPVAKARECFAVIVWAKQNDIQISRAWLALFSTGWRNVSTSMTLDGDVPYPQRIVDLFGMAVQALSL